jgi:hypothetical protein
MASQELPGGVDFESVFAEQDVFRLAIRGHAALEELIDTYITEAFGGSTPAANLHGARPNGVGSPHEQPHRKDPWLVTAR